MDSVRLCRCHASVLRRVEGIQAKPTGETIMTTVALNIHEFYNDLKGAGFTEQQAEVIANIQSKTATATIEQTKHDFRLDDITTNKDLDARIKETELKIELVRADLKRDLADTKAELSRLILTVGVGMGLAQLVAIFLLFMRSTGKV